MRKSMLAATCAAAFAAVPATSANAAPPERASDPFVCPVLTISEQAAGHSDRFNSLGNGEYTFGPGSAGDPTTFNGNVPDQATNAEGAGSPGGAHAAPGDTGYTAIWSGNG